MGGRFVSKSFFLLEGALLFDEKIYQSGAKAVFLTLVSHPNLPPDIICLVCTFFGDRFV